MRRRSATICGFLQGAKYQERSTFTYIAFNYFEKNVQGNVEETKIARNEKNMESLENYENKTCIEYSQNRTGSLA